MEPKTKEQDKTLARQEAKNAAVLLLDDYIRQNSKKVAGVLADIIPFFDECSWDGLRSAVSCVNTTFATVALDVIKDHDAKDEDDPDRRLLPCGADDMQQAVFYLTKFINLLGPFFYTFDRRGVPAIDMCRNAFCNYQSRG